MLLSTGAWAVVTVFHPGPALLEAVEGLLQVMDAVIVVDDGSGASADEILVAAEGLGAVLERLPENSGIAAALNKGVARAVADGALLIYTFDQDSRPQDGFREAMETAWNRAVGLGHRVAFVVPEFFSDVRQAHSALPDGTLLARNVIQSGMLIPATVLDEIGPFRADFFIDLVDTEFELRVRRAGLLTVAAPSAHLDHQLGQQYERRILGLRLSLPGVPPVITVSTPFRYFYRVRNRVILNKEYWSSATAQIARDTLLDVVHFANALMVARPRRTLARVMRSGWSAARQNRMGRMPLVLLEASRTVRWAARPVDRGVNGAAR
ncbi:glycosyltransferase [Microbacterium sp. Gd 4-13]|uniref:glycosyltransferase n=1 Tax=Microbacterium sp. Gd 4-13 TaxID=2173179 RepID=UPI0014040B5B|nr:glycosyltransferase [Microbacterium sp. Gd 4-13]